MNLPLIQSDNQELMLVQTRWKAILDSLLGGAEGATSTIVTANCTLLPTDELVICTPAVAMTIRIPTGALDNRSVRVVNASTAVVTILGQSLTYTLALQKDAVTIYGTGKAFYIVDQSFSRQVVVGTPQTVNGTRSNTGYGAPTNANTVTITPTRTGTFKIWGSFVIESGAANVAPFLRIAASVGSPNVQFSQELVGQVFTSGQTGGAAGGLAYVIATLTAGITYTFTVEVKSASSTVNVRNDIPTNGQALVAEELT